MSFWNPRSEMFGDVHVSYEYSVPSLVYIGFRTLLKWNMHANSTTKYSDMLKVLPDSYLSFLWDDDCLIYCASC